MAPGVLAEPNGDEHKSNAGYHDDQGSELADKLRSLVTEFVNSNPKSQQAFERARKALPGGNTRSVLYSDPFPLVIRSGRDCYVTSVDGREYVDFLSDFSAGMYGHSHPTIKQAVTEALETGFSLGGLTEKEAQLGELIKQRIPSMELIRFCNSGTEANTMALALAVAFTGRKKVRQISNPRTNPVNLPHDFIFSTYNDIEATRPLITDDLAAILVEPMQGVGGMVPATEEFLRLLREASRAAGVLLIFDEVVTSRLHYHGLQGFHSIMPDLTTLGKYIGGGFSFGAFGGRADVMALFDPTSGGTLGHSGTFNNNIFTMTAGVTAFKLLTEESIRRVNALGDLLRVKANEMVQEAGLPMKLSGIGSAIGFQYFGEQSEPLRDVLYFFLLKKGFMIGRRGFVSLNLAHMQEHVERLLDAIRAFVHFVS